VDPLYVARLVQPTLEYRPRLGWLSGPVLTSG
jgi:hypothetical protein